MVQGEIGDQVMQCQHKALWSSRKPSLTSSSLCHRTQTPTVMTGTLLWTSGTCGSSSSLASPSSWSSAAPLWLICLTTGAWGVKESGTGRGRSRGGD